ncbi:hypothetical protein A9Q99_08245 [Gammaproteobacteria bacterium 45_16_T64]|nr:hypothetical protein A9Q99_08245 [Gammaproteobacteria bacterium 45_16_T64]
MFLRSLLLLIMVFVLPIEGVAETIETAPNVTMEQAAKGLGFKQSEESYAKVYSRFAGVGLVLLFCVGVWVLLKGKINKGRALASDKTTGNKIVTKESTQIAYGVKAILLQVEGKDVLVVQTKDSHTVTQLMSEPTAKSEQEVD